MHISIHMRGPKGHINLRILQTMVSGIPLAWFLGTRLLDPFVYVVVWGPIYMHIHILYPHRYVYIDVYIYIYTYICMSIATFMIMFMRVLVFVFTSRLMFVSDLFLQLL